MSAMALVRYGIPVVLAVAGMVCLLVLPAGSRIEAWAGFTGSALAVLSLNLLFRLSAGEDRERAREDAAREHFTRHGHWPEDR